MKRRKMIHAPSNLIFYIKKNKFSEQLMVIQWNDSYELTENSVL